MSYLAIVRALVLGAIIYGAITAIPMKTIAPLNKLLISVAVVVIYALIDYFAVFLSTIRSYLCRLVCDCGSGSGPVGSGLGIGSGSYDGIDTDSLSTEVANAIKLLDARNETTTEQCTHTPKAEAVTAEAAEEEDAAVKATGLRKEDPSDPVPAETKEGFMNYSSW